MSRPSPRLVAAVALLVAVALFVVAAIYWAEPAKSIPSWFPGHQSGSSHHHVKHGLAAFIVGLAALVLAWFQSGPRARST